MLKRAKTDNTVDLPNQKGQNGSGQISGKGSPNNQGTVMNGSGGNPVKPRNSNKPNPAANGVGGLGKR